MVHFTWQYYSLNKLIYSLGINEMYSFTSEEVCINMKNNYLAPCVYGAQQGCIHSGVVE